jgi:hypothetical protein
MALDPGEAFAYGEEYQIKRWCQEGVTPGWIDEFTEARMDGGYGAMSSTSTAETWG